MEKTVRTLISYKFVRVAEGDLLSEIVLIIAMDKTTKLACVLDKDDKLKGIITPKEMLQEVDLREFGHISHAYFGGPKILQLLTSKYAKDIMSPPVSVKPSDSVEKAIHIMLDKGFYEVPVVDEQGKMIGVVNYFSIISASAEYLKL